MKKNLFSFPPAFPAVLLLCLLCLLPRAASAATMLKIGIASGISSGTLSGNSVRGTDAAGSDCSFSGGVALSAAGDRVLVGGRSALLPVRFTSASPISYGRTAFEGDLLLIRAPSGFTLIDEIELEEYLRGILKVEANPAWPQESLKAQAILARTYALRNRGRHRNQGFDLCAGSHCQIYRGVNGYDPRTDAAVAATRGIILCYGGEPAQVFFHADSGGATTDASSVWGGRVPYLVSVREPVPVVSPYSSWTATLTPGQVEQALAKISVRVGPVRSVSVEERDSSGRAKTLRVVGDSGSARVSGNAFRMALGSSLVKSTLFEIDGGPSTGSPAPEAVPAPTAAPAPVRPLPAGGDPLIHMTRQGVFSDAELMDMLLHPEKRDQYVRIGQGRPAGGAAPASPIPQAARPTRTYRSGPGFVLRGRGWGHGVGLSQWGSKALAEQGWTAERILALYYPGTRLAVTP